MPGLLKPCQVVRPQLLIIATQFIQCLPRVDAGIVLIIKMQHDSIISHRFDMVNIDIFLANLQNRLV